MRNVHGVRGSLSATLLSKCNRNAFRLQLVTCVADGCRSIDSIQVVRLLFTAVLTKCALPHVCARIITTTTPKQQQLLYVGLRV